MQSTDTIAKLWKYSIQ